MKRILYLLAIGVGLSLSSGASAQPPPQQEEAKPSMFQKMFGKSAPTAKQKYTTEEQQLKEYWANYYKSLANYYASLNNVDWVAYYKNNGYPIDPQFYNPYGTPPGVTMVPMQSMQQQMGGPVMVPPARMSNGVNPASYTDRPVSGNRNLEKGENPLQPAVSKTSPRR